MVLNDSSSDDGDRLSTEQLAGIIVDALHRAGLLRDADVNRALLIAEEEINVRKVLGDY
jgi:hypothetical protein